LNAAGHSASPSGAAARHRSRRRVRIARPQDPVWLFDLDNTLHHASHAIFPRINVAMITYMMRTLGLAREEADALRTAYTKRYGAALLGLARHHPIDPHEFLAEVHTFPELAPLLRTERGLARLLGGLPGRRILFTNGPEAYARAILAHLGIDRLFERVIAIEQMRDRSQWRAKPDPVMLRRTLRRAQVRACDATLVEDTRGHLKSYRRMGLRTVWMVGFLPPPRAMTATANASHGLLPRLAPLMPGTGRPHYVDWRVHSLKSLQSGVRPRQRSCSPQGIDMPLHRSNRSA
jgi:pyrimidine 5'-nucleotidase